MIRICLPLILLVATISPLFAEETEERKAYLARRAAEKAGAEQAVKELGARDYGTLTGDEFIRLALAYNELGDNRMAFDAINRVPDSYLVLRKQLDLKATCFHNANSLKEGGPGRVRELAFIDRCIDKKYGNQGVWLWRKAKVLCQTSVAPAVLTIGDNIGTEAQIIDREQYEHSFEVLKRACEVEPNLIKLDDVGVDWMWSQSFPLLSSEQRFKDLMNK